MVNRLLTLGALGMLFAAPLSAQDMRAHLRDDFQRQRDNVLGMVDAMPESGLRTAPTEGVRDFAQQIEHIVQGNLGIISSGFDRPVQVEGMDPEVYLNSKDELKRFVNEGFEAIDGRLEQLSTADMEGDTQLFGQATVDRWKLIQTAYEHGVWTLGATVPYLRLQGSAPPGYNLIPGN